MSQAVLRLFMVFGSIFFASCRMNVYVHYESGAGMSYHVQDTPSSSAGDLSMGSALLNYGYNVGNNFMQLVLPGNSVGQLGRRLSEIKVRWGVTVEFNPGDENENILDLYSVEYKPLQNTDYVPAINSLVGALESYPDELFRKKGDLDILLVESIASEGGDYAGFFLPDDLVVVAFDDSLVEHWFHETVHHEIYHFLEYRESFFGFAKKNNEWIEINKECRVQ
jgi:hypothetical protein